MSQKQMFEASVQVEAGLELREMIRPLLVQVGRSIRSLRMRAASPATTRHSTSTARGTLESRVAPFQKG